MRVSDWSSDVCSSDLGTTAPSPHDGRMVELAKRPMPTSRVTHASNELVIRLRRVEGQVRGIKRMVTEGAPCSEVLTQLGAARDPHAAPELPFHHPRIPDYLEPQRISTVEDRR